GTMLVANGQIPLFCYERKRFHSSHPDQSEQDVERERSVVLQRETMWIWVSVHTEEVQQWVEVITQKHLHLLMCGWGSASHLCSEHLVLGEWMEYSATRKTGSPGNGTRGGGLADCREEKEQERCSLEVSSGSVCQRLRPSTSSAVLRVNQRVLYLTIVKY
ncbi:hypothetical protein NFI96_031365, partial [Prochilodus magdalenae]